MTRLAEMFNVNHFIVSQVNPHVVPFLLKEEDSISEQAQKSAASTPSGPSWLHSATHLAKDEALHRMRTMAEIGIFPNALTKAISVLSQKYSGDITIFPEISYNDFPRMLSNPTPELMENAMLCGERATWPKLSRIRNHCAIELALDDAVQKLRARVVFSPSQIDLRIGVPQRSRSDNRKEGRARSKRRERPLSQNSAPATAPPDPPNPNKVLKKTHRKSRSMATTQDTNGLIIAATVPRISTHDLAAIDVPGPHETITSSGGETSIYASSRNSSSSTLSITSPFDSPDSPPSSPTRAGHKRFSKSQPSTPSGNRFWDLTSNLTNELPPRLKAKGSPPLSSFLSMTPKTGTKQSSTETKYKRLFNPMTLVGPSAPRAPKSPKKRSTTEKSLSNKSPSDPTH